MNDIRHTLGSLANRYAVREGITVSLKTNLGPAVTLYKANDNKNSGPSILERLGLKAAVTVTDNNGRVLLGSEEPPPTEPIKALIVWAIILLIVFIVLRGLLKK